MNHVKGQQCCIQTCFGTLCSWVPRRICLENVVLAFFLYIFYVKTSRNSFPKDIKFCWFFWTLIMDEIVDESVLARICAPSYFLQVLGRL